MGLSQFAEYFGLDYQLDQSVIQLLLRENPTSSPNFKEKNIPCPRVDLFKQEYVMLQSIENQKYILHKENLIYTFTLFIR